MSEAMMRARSTSEIVDAVFVLYRRDATQYLVLAALSVLPTLIGQLVLPTPTAENLSSIGGAVWIWMLVGPIVSFMLGATLLTDASSCAYLGEPVDAAASIRRAIPLMPRVLVASVLAYFLCILGLIALFLPALYVIARFFAIVPAIVIERVGIAEAFTRSSVLAEGRKWHILGTIGLGMLIVLVASIGASAAAAVLPNVALQLLVTSVISVFVKPILYLTVTVLYYDTRIRSEGFDLERLAAALDATPASGTSPAT